MANELTLKEATDGMNFLGMCMETRHNHVDVEAPIQTWDMPKKEKEFFTVFAMNVVLEGDGFECLAEQHSPDLEAFIRLLKRIGAQKTSAFVKSTLATLKNLAPAEEDQRTSKYYALFKRDKVSLKLLDYVGGRIYLSYYLRAQAIDTAGGSIFNPKEWKGKLPNPSRKG